MPLAWLTSHNTRDDSHLSWSSCVHLRQGSLRQVFQSPDGHDMAATTTVSTLWRFKSMAHDLSFINEARPVTIITLGDLSTPVVCRWAVHLRCQIPTRRRFRWTSWALEGISVLCLSPEVPLLSWLLRRWPPFHSSDYIHRILLLFSWHLFSALPVSYLSVSTVKHVFLANMHYQHVFPDHDYTPSATPVLRTSVPLPRLGGWPPQSIIPCTIQLHCLPHPDHGAQGLWTTTQTSDFFCWLISKVAFQYELASHLFFASTYFLLTLAGSTIPNVKKLYKVYRFMGSIFSVFMPPSGEYCIITKHSFILLVFSWLFSCEGTHVVALSFTPFVCQVGILPTRNFSLLRIRLFMVYGSLCLSWLLSIQLACYQTIINLLPMHPRVPGVHTLILSLSICFGSFYSALCFYN